MGSAGARNQSSALALVDVVFSQTELGSGGIEEAPTERHNGRSPLIWVDECAPLVSGDKTRWQAWIRESRLRGHPETERVMVEMQMEVAQSGR